MKPSACSIISCYLLLLLSYSTSSANNATFLQDQKGDFKNISIDLDKLKEILGSDFEILRDSTGEVIGFAAKEIPDTKTTSTAAMAAAKEMPDNETTSSPLTAPPIFSFIKGLSFFSVGFKKMVTKGKGGSKKYTGSTDDVSFCCSTREVFYFNKTLVDYFGRTRVIAQINELGVYQLIRHGFCSTTGGCTGQCDQIYVHLYLVVHPTQAGDQVSFSLFKIPGYCTCRVSALASNG